jgi:hypothetical protein
MVSKTGSINWVKMAANIAGFPEQAKSPMLMPFLGSKLLWLDALHYLWAKILPNWGLI